MGRTIYKVELYQKDPTTNVYSVTPDLTLTDATMFEADGSLETSADSFSINIRNLKLQNGTYPYRDLFRVDDRVYIYVKEDDNTGVWTDATDKLFDGLVMSLTYSISSGGTNTIRVEGLNRLEKLFNVSKPARYNGQTASYIVNNLIESVNNDQAWAGASQINQITWDSGNAVTTTTIAYNRNYRPVFEMIEELSQIKINKEQNYIYYIDAENNFYWVAKNYVSASTLTEGTDFHEISVRRKVWEVSNAMIVDCGPDAYGKTVLALYYDETSAATYGLKWSSGKEVETEIANQIMIEEKIQNPASFDDESFPFPTTAALAGTYTFYINERDTNGDILGTNVAVTTKAGYNAEIRNQARWAGKEYAKSVIDLVGNVRPKVTLKIRGNYWYTTLGRLSQGSLITLNTTTIPLRNALYSLDLRISGVSHSISKTGWWVHFELEEDIETGGS